jgi:hypothetical protein
MAAPILTAASVNAAGTALALTWDQSVTHGTGSPVVTADGVQQTGSILGGSGANWTLSGLTVFAHSAVTVTIAAGAFLNGGLEGNALITGQAVTNNSTRAHKPLRTHRCTVRPKLKTEDCSVTSPDQE